MTGIFEPRRDEVTGEWRELYDEELSDLYIMRSSVIYTPHLILFG